MKFILLKFEKSQVPIDTYSVTTLSRYCACELSRTLAVAPCGVLAVRLFFSAGIGLIRAWYYWSP